MPGGRGGLGRLDFALAPEAPDMKKSPVVSRNAFGPSSGTAHPERFTDLAGALGLRVGSMRSTRSALHGMP